MTLRALPFLVVSLFAATVCPEVFAQTVTLSTTVVRRANREPTGIKTNVISYADCAADDKFTFKLATALVPTTLTLSVWSGSVADCGSPMRAPGTVPEQCWEVGTYNPPPTGSFDIPVRDVLPHHATGALSAGADVCDTVASTGTGNGTLTIYLIPVNGNTLQGTAANYAVTYDLHGPNPPTNFHINIGDTRLIPAWTASSDTTIIGYRLFCEQSDSCVSSFLIPGSVPASTVPGGIQSSNPGPNATSGEVSGLANGEQYICGVAAKDALGNVGELSDTACGVPQLVNGYYKAYRAAGGAAGGGYCSFGRAPRGAMLSPLLFSALGALLVRRKRRSAR
ncbi:MAG: hypothetical protein QM756_06125 [Polyangiaceae bacterium]